MESGSMMEPLDLKSDNSVNLRPGSVNKDWSCLPRRAFPKPTPARRVRPSGWMDPAAEMRRLVERVSRQSSKARCSKRRVTLPAVDWSGVFGGLFGDRQKRLNVGNRHRFPARLDQSARLPNREQPADGEQRRAGHLRQLFA